MRLLSLCLALCLPAGVLAEDRFQDHLDDVLKSLALTRSDLAVAKDYLPDPDRLSVARDRMRDPTASDRWLRAFSRDVGTASHSAAVASAGMLLRRASSVESESELARASGSLEDLIAAYADQMEGPAPTTPLIALVHPGWNVRPETAARLMDHGRSIEIGARVQMAVNLLNAIERMGEGATGPVEKTYPYGRVIVGTMGDDVYEGHYALIVDPGGNDVYRNAAGVTTPDVPVSVVVDMAGDDRYEGEVAVGRDGIGIVVDRSGDDIYKGGDASLGVGLGGVGVLIDESGNDTYRSSVGGQGFGLYGVGVLIDLNGDDVYEVDLLGQGCAGPGGAGLLVDRNGNDAYKAGGPHKDFREDGAHAQSMGQGFSLGIDTEASGGAGILVDLRGQDRYEVAYFGQGAAHWAGLGALYDGGGDDSYAARRYAQGCGVHLSAGIFVDDSGDDVYSLWGVGQGCGHDLAVGVLADREGNDRYRTTWLGQGVATANGTGLLFDRSGNDVYSAQGADTQGHGVKSRDFGSTGILIDGGGDDRYRERDGTRLVTSGTNGARYDAGAP